MKKLGSKILWIVAGILLCVVVACERMEYDFNSPEQIILRHASYFIAATGLLVHSIENKEENSSSINYGYKLLGETLLMLLIVVECAIKIVKN